MNNAVHVHANTPANGDEVLVRGKVIGRTIANMPLYDIALDDNRILRQVPLASLEKPVPKAEDPVVQAAGERRLVVQAPGTPQPL